MTTLSTTLHRATRRPWIRGDIPFTLSAVVLALLIAVAVIAPWVAPADPSASNFVDSLASPSSAHPLGADQSGRDLLSRALYGTRLSLINPIIVLGIASLIGIAAGMLAAWRPGWCDALISRATDVMFAFPGLLFAVFTVAIVGKGLVAAVVALGLAYFPTIAKLTRSVAQAEFNRSYVESYLVQGMGAIRLCLTRVLPNIIPVILGYVAVLFGDVLLGLAGLSYLGFGAQPPSSDWGLMVSEGQLALVQGSFWSAMVPAAAIVITVVSVNIVGVRVADRLSKAVVQ